MSDYPPRGRAADLEAQNDEHLEGLHSKLKALHSVTSGIRQDSQQHNSLLDATSSRFDVLRTNLSSSANNFSRTITANKSPTRLAMILVGVILILYLLYRLVYA